MALIPFPNVPALPGVPQLARNPQFPPGPPPALASAVALGRLALSFLVKPVWGIFRQPPPQTTTNDGLELVTVVAKLLPVVVPDSIRDFGYRKEYDISDYPTQDGSFTTYNKVARPFEASVRMSKSGSSTLDVLTSNPLSSGGSGQSARARFLDQIEAIIGTTDFYQIRTPERTYLNCNVLGYELTRRGAEGAYFLTEVDLYFREVRTTTAQYTQTAITTQNAKNPSAQPVQNTGAVQGQQVGG